MRLDIVKAFFGLRAANVIGEGTAAGNEDQRVARGLESREPGVAPDRIGEAAAELGDKRAR